MLLIIHSYLFYTIFIALFYIIRYYDKVSYDTLSFLYFEMKRKEINAQPNFF